MIDLPSGYSQTTDSEANAQDCYGDVTVCDEEEEETANSFA